ncbi:MAG: glycosyltransferase family 2 protein [Flammeovirgaceae bacterium]|nr:glycosyltransferase family 2 protein [Flammeovirgaceae bacterium]
MKVSGFSFVRNAVKFDYPVVEAITSILPLCNEFVIAVGNSDDHTLELLKSIHSDKIKIIHTEWDDTQRQGGRTFALETDKALQAVAHDSDWCFYIQADEVVHEKYHEVIQNAMIEFKDKNEVDGLLFNYLHFYGSYDYTGEAYRWYRREIRLVKNNRNIYSYRDAQGFRKKVNEKLNVKLIDAFIYHYGWVREPKAMRGKQRNFNHYYFDDKWIDQNVPKTEIFDYSGIDALKKFEGTHPMVMHKRIDSMNWKFDHDISKKNFKVKDRFKRWVEKWFGWRIGEYRNYKII